MDFKVAGTQNGITALQMDIKIQGITKEIMQVALAQAREGRLHILGKVREALEGARGELSAFAPRMRSEEHTSELQSLMRISYAVFCLQKNTHYADEPPTL